MCQQFSAFCAASGTLASMWSAEVLQLMPRLLQSVSALEILLHCYMQRV
jgi:hypothetical protein